MLKIPNNFYSRIRKILSDESIVMYMLIFEYSYNSSSIQIFTVLVRNNYTTIPVFDARLINVEKK